MRICIWLTGGLGNQLFQYALSRRLQLEFPDARIYFDPSNFENDFRTLELTKFFDGLDFRSFSQLLMHRPKVQRFVSILYGDIKKDFITIQESECADFGDLLSMIRGAKSVYLIGYWQQSAIYDCVQKDIVEDITLHKRNFLLSGELEDYIAVHVRLTDYLHPTNSGTFQQLDEEYYTKAIKAHSPSGEVPKLLVFTDSIETFKVRFRFWQDYEVVFAGEICSNTYEEFSLMTRATRFILANSTFSYWASLIASNKRSVIRVFPRSFYIDPLRNHGYERGEQFVFDSASILI